MSRIGKKPIIIPAGIEIKLAGNQEKGYTVEVKNSQGLLVVPLPARVKVEEKDQELILTVLDSESKDDKALWGLSRTLINNAIIGSSKGYEKTLELVGVGFRAALKGKQLNLQLGFSHDINFDIPEGIKITVEKQTIIKISGSDKQQIGMVVSKIKLLRIPEPYKGKGIREQGQYILRKEGKKK